MIFHLLNKWLKRPALFPKHLKDGIQLFQSLGKEGLINYVFRRYLPTKYLLKTKIHIKEPSRSIHSKLNTFKESQNEHHVKILLIRSGAMGDVILTTPIIRILHQKFDGLCSINVATRYPEVFRNNPYIEKIFTIQEIRSIEEQFNLIVDLDYSYEKNRKKHITEVYKFYVFGTSLDNECMQPELFPNDHDRTVTEAFIETIGVPYIVCHNRIDPTQPYRNLSAQYWEDLILKFIDQTNLMVVQIGSKNMDIALNVNKSNLIDARGVFNLQQAHLLIARSQLFLGVDAGPLHIAATTSTPIICFFTIAHHDVRKPLRSKDTIFKAIFPNIECYGCQDQFKFTEEWYCKKLNFPCKLSFNMKNALQDCLSIIKQ